MPLYEYRCRSCDAVFEVRRPMDASTAPAICPEGHPETVKLLSKFATVGASASTSGFSPGAVPSGGCGAGCGCAH